MRVSLANSSRSFSVEPGQSVLDAALSAGLNLPHSCKGGNCGSCRARLVSGDFVYPHGRPPGLADTEAAEGLVLMCQMRALGDLVLETFEQRSPEEISVKRLPGRIERKVALAHDVLGLYLRLPAAEPFHFEPGQYIDILLPGGRRRSFSIASPPHDSRLLELHVRRVAGGEFTEPLFAAGADHALLSIEGPLGRFVYRAPGAGRAQPMLLIGGGTGLAPLNSIIRHVIEKGIDRPMTLFWGVREERDLYAHAALTALARRAASFRYVPVLSEASASWPARRGWVHAAVLAEVANLSEYEVYASGPPAMIAAVQASFLARGVDPDRLYVDSFDYAPDSLERQRKMESTRS